MKNRPIKILSLFLYAILLNNEVLKDNSNFVLEHHTEHRKIIFKVEMGWTFWWKETYIYLLLLEEVLSL